MIHFKGKPSVKSCEMPRSVMALAPESLPSDALAGLLTCSVRRSSSRLWWTKAVTCWQTPHKSLQQRALLPICTAFPIESYSGCQKQCKITKGKCTKKGFRWKKLLTTHVENPTWSINNWDTPCFSHSVSKIRWFCIRYGLNGICQMLFTSPPKRSLVSYEKQKRQQAW